MRLGWHTIAIASLGSLAGCFLSHSADDPHTDPGTTGLPVALGVQDSESGAMTIFAPAFGAALSCDALDSACPSAAIRIELGAAHLEGGTFALGAPGAPFAYTCGSPPESVGGELDLPPGEGVLALRGANPALATDGVFRIEPCGECLGTGARCAASADCCLLSCSDGVCQP